MGLDVDKGEHHTPPLDPEGTRLYDKPLPQEEHALRALFEQLATHGPVLVVVDRPASIGALPMAVARDVGVEVAYQGLRQGPGCLGDHVCIAASVLALPGYRSAIRRIANPGKVPHLPSRRAHQPRGHQRRARVLDGME